ncbi:MAG: MaoC family dehydratase N-terminal domain-containing protein [Candidatus Thorarchaeota archaeon]
MIDRKFVGYEFGKMEVPIPRWKVSQFAKAIRNDNPIYYDIEVAKGKGYSDLPVPPTFYTTMTFSDKDFYEILGIDFRKLLDGSREYKYYSDCCAGDIVSYQTKIKSITEKEGKRGKMDILIAITTIKNKVTEKKVLDMIITLIIFH